MSEGPAWWRNLGANSRGALWLLASSLLFSGMNALIKWLGAHIPTFEIVFFRSLFGLLVLLPFLAGGDAKALLRTDRIGMHMLRAGLALLAMSANFYAVTAMPLADAIAISFTKPLFMIVLAAILLHEVVRWRRSLATLVGFVGVLIMLRPGAESATLPAFVALFGALLVTLILIVIKKLTETERPLTVLIYFSLLTTLGGALPAWLVWVEPTPAEWAGLVVMGAMGSVGQYCAVRALRVGEATVVTPVEYTQLIFAGFLGFVWFGEIPTLWTLVGASVIVAATLYITYRESQIAKPPTAPTGPDV